MINHRKIVIGFVGIIAIITLAFPVVDAIFNLMNQKSDIVYIGPVLLFVAGFLAIWGIINLANSIIINLKSKDTCQKKPIGKSKKNLNNKNV